MRNSRAYVNLALAALVLAVVLGGTLAEDPVEIPAHFWLADSTGCTPFAQPNGRPIDLGPWVLTRSHSSAELRITRSWRDILMHLINNTHSPDRVARLCAASSSTNVPGWSEFILFESDARSIGLYNPDPALAGTWKAHGTDFAWTLNRDGTILENGITCTGYTWVRIGDVLLGGGMTNSPEEIVSFAPILVLDGDDERARLLNGKTVRRVK